MAKPKSGCRSLAIVLGDQLNADSAAFDEFDYKRDVVWMAEVAEESTHVWTHKARIVMFLASMRHFRDALVKRTINLHYRQLDDRGNKGWASIQNSSTSGIWRCMSMPLNGSNYRIHLACLSSPTEA